jgi:hypothetical protein
MKVRPSDQAVTFMQIRILAFQFVIIVSDLPEKTKVSDPDPH